VAAILLASPARAELYRWKDAEGVTHYAEDLERVPAEYREGAEIVTPRRVKSRGPLPILGDQTPPGPGEASSEETGPDAELAPTIPEAPPAAPAPTEAPGGPAATRAAALPAEPVEAPLAEPVEARSAEPVQALPAEPVAALSAAPMEALPADADPREIEIAELEHELAARREELKTLISQKSFDSSQISADPRLSELAEIVPRLQAELDALRGELGRP
jgi:hypothetical protein